MFLAVLSDRSTFYLALELRARCELDATDVDVLINKDTYRVHNVSLSQSHDFRLNISNGGISGGRTRAVRSR